MALDVTFWGTRGGVPVTGEHVERHGGATTHIEIDCGERTEYDRILIDCGTGVVDMGHERGDVFGKGLVLQTHMHWDHIQGFPFFHPFFDPSTSFEFWGVDRAGRPVEEIYTAQMSKPMFPVGMEALGADLSFERIEEVGSRRLDGVSVAWTEVEHPSGSSAFRVEADDAVFVFSGDVEVRKGSSEKLVEFARDADVFLMDAQYLPEEYDKHEGFGHSTCRDAVRVAERAGVSELYLTHHDAAHDDAKLDRKLEIAREAAGDDLYVDNARARQEIRITSDEGELDRASSPSDPVRG